MTKEEINRAVAIEVMGWNSKCPWTWSDDKGYTLDVSEFKPAECIDHAWMVVEKLNSMGGCFSLINDDDGHWACVSDGDQPACGRFVGSTTFEIEREDQWADTAPMAISLAALDAVKEGRDE